MLLLFSRRNINQDVIALSKRACSQDFNIKMIQFTISANKKSAIQPKSKQYQTLQLRYTALHLFTPHTFCKQACVSGFHYHNDIFTLSYSADTLAAR